MFIKALHPLVWGQPIILEVRPNDPRDLLRGNYSNLNYSFSYLCRDSIANDLDSLNTYNFGDEFFVELEKKGSYHQPIGLWKQPPTNGKPFLRLIAASKPYDQCISLKGGIESYFDKKEDAEQLDAQSNWANADSLTVAVTVMVSDKGIGRIKSLEIKEKKPSK
jgi:uncharacterized membrane-anchored protein